MQENEICVLTYDMLTDRLKLILPSVFYEFSDLIKTVQL